MIKFEPFNPRSLEDYLRISEAAEILGVTTKTLRNWDRAGKVKAKRHPINAYRLYLRNELEALITALPKEKA